MVITNLIEHSTPIYECNKKEKIFKMSKGEQSRDYLSTEKIVLLILNRIKRNKFWRY